MILSSFDDDKEAKINPCDCVDKRICLPKVGITCFSKELIDRYVEIFNCKEITYFNCVDGKIPIYKLNYKGIDFALYKSRLGAPASTICYEEAIAMGMDKLIMFGTCGVLDKNISDLAIIIPNFAIRDEGTSFHYIKANDEIKISDKYRKEFINILNSKKCSYIEGKVWTTDALYRETENKILRMKEKGAICVDMECSAMNAVSQFREKDLFQFFYAADNLDDIKWNKRSLENIDKFDEKEKIIFLALELALKMNEND